MLTQTRKRCTISSSGVEIDLAYSPHGWPGAEITEGRYDADL